MLADRFCVKDDFPPVDYGQWRSLVESELQDAPFAQKLVTHTYEGIEIQPLYVRSGAQINAAEDFEGVPGLPPFVRGTRPAGSVLTGWDLRQEHAHPDLQATQQAIAEDIRGGATSLLLRFDLAARNGIDPDDDAAATRVGQDGLMAYDVNDLDQVLAEVDPANVGIALEAGAAFLPAAAQLAALWQRRGAARDQVRGAFNADPLAVLAREGQLPYALPLGLTLAAELAQWTATHYPHVTAIGVDTSPYHHAGATATQDIALGLAAAVAYLRAMVELGLSIDDAARQIEFRISVGTHHFLSIAKLRAARRLWAGVVEACGGSPSSGAMKLHARPSLRALTRFDPYVNMLRNTASVFAAGIGGAQTITSEAFDVRLGLPSGLARRVARNTALILQEEAHLHRVVDPAGGSWFLTDLTRQLATQAWSFFQEIERQGGLPSALQSGWVARQIESAFAPRAKDIARRKEGITGVSEFPFVAEQRVVSAAPDLAALRDAAVSRLTLVRPPPSSLAKLSGTTNRMNELLPAASRGASCGQLARAIGFRDGATRLDPLPPRFLAEPFEQLRDASDAWQAAHGHRPRAFLVTLGPVSHFTARATYAKNFFEAGGYEVSGGENYADPHEATRAFQASEATVAVLCSSDKLYPELVPPVASQLKSSGARCIVLAGHPGANEAAWRAAGVDRFIFMKCDVLATLRELLREEGVLS